MVSRSKCWYDHELNNLDYVIARICLRSNDIRLVMKYLRALFCYDDYVMLFSYMRVAMKEYSHEIFNELMTMTIQGIRLYDLY